MKPCPATLLAVLVLAVCPLHNRSGLPAGNAAGAASNNGAVAAQVTGPTDAVPGELVVLDAAKSEAQSYAWTVIPETKNHRVFEQGKILVLSSGSESKFVVVLAVAKDGQVAQAVHAVVFRAGPHPHPGPAPPPPAPPGPDLPDGRYKLAKWAYDNSAGLPKAKDIGQCFAATAAKIAAGVLGDPPSVEKDTRDCNRNLLGEPEREQWRGFFAQLKEKLITLDESGELRTLADYQTAWTELAIGLKAR